MKTLFRTLLLLCVCCSQLALAASESAVVLMYHRFGEDAYPSTSVRLAQFDAHLDYLEKNGFQVLPLAEIVAALKSGKALPDKTIAISIDDAYASIYTHAYPRLKQRGWPFTVFVASAPVDQGLPDYMTWAQMREMARHGASFANHTSSHDYLVRRQKGESEAEWFARVTSDIRSGRQRLQEELKDVAALFAYPYGEYNLALAEFIAAEGYTGFGQHSGAMGKSSDFRFLPRFPINETYGEMDSFRSKVMSLAMPLAHDPAVESATSDKRPAVTLTFDKQHPRPRQLSCYFNNQPLKLNWLDDFRVKVQSEKDLPAGRSRYNCTAPSDEKGRYYWFSQAWVRQVD